MYLHGWIYFYTFAQSFNMRSLLFVIPLLMLAVACSPKKQVTSQFVEVPVPVETVRTEYIHDTRIDSVFVKDSIDRWMKGDTMFIYKEHTKYKYINKTDTVIRIDTIPKIVKVETKSETIKEVEVNHIKWYQSALMWIGGVVLLSLIIYLTIKIKALWK